MLQSEMLNEPPETFSISGVQILSEGDGHAFRD